MMGPVPLSSPQWAAPTDSCLGGDPGQAQVEDNSPNVQHAANLRGDRGELAIRALTPGDGQTMPALLLLRQNHPTEEGRELLKAYVLAKIQTSGKMQQG